MHRILDNYGSDESSSEEEVNESRKRKAYSTEWKLEVIQEAKRGSVRSASKKYSISRSSIRNWIKKEQDLLLTKDTSTSGKNRKRPRGGGRPLTFADLDRELATWIRGQRAKKHQVSRQIIQQQADKMFNSEIDEGHFTASRGWLEKFLNRHNFRLRVPTTVCQKAPKGAQGAWLLGVEMRKLFDGQDRGKRDSVCISI